MAQILLVEDEVDLRDNIEIVLSHAGHEVLTAGNGREALNIIEENPPDIVVSDISMPVMSGMQMLGVVRQTMPALANMPIIMLTALGDRENVIDGREAGADDYLTKPVDYQILLATIEARLTRQQQAKALKDKQFIKLFKGLTQPPEEPSSGTEPVADTPLTRIAALNLPSLRGRAQLLFPEDFLPEYRKLPPSARDKVCGAMRRVINDGLTAEDIAVDIGGGGLLLVLNAAERSAATERFTLLRMRLAQTLGFHHPGDDAGTEDDLGDNDAAGGDLELKETLKAYYFDSSGGGRVQETAPSFADIQASFSVAYEPILDTRTKDANTFQVCWRRPVGERILTGVDALLLGADDPLMCDLTAFAMDTAACDIMALRGRPNQGHAPSTVILPVPLAIFQQMGIYKVERQLDDMAQLLDSKLLGFHVSGLDDDISIGALRKVFAALSRAGELLVADLDLNLTKPERLLALGCRTLHVDAAAVLNPSLPADRVLQILMGSIHHAAQMGFEVWASNVANTALGRQLVSAGAVLLSGDVVGAPRSTPEFQPAR